MKPDNALTLNFDMDLSFLALEEAARLLPSSRFYRVTVSEMLLREANRILIPHMKVVEENPFAPVIGINVDPTFDNHEWTLESGGEIFWSPGA